MDKRTAKREALKMWKWLSEHDGAGKREYSLDVKTGIDKWAAHCPLCEYLCYACEICPLGGQEAHCFDTDAPFHIWNNNGHKAETAKLVYNEIKAWHVA